MRRPGAIVGAASARWAVACSAAALTLLLTGCTLLYLPPVPAEAVSGEIGTTKEPVELLAGDLVVEAASLRLELRVAPPARPGYLAVQWFDPSLREGAAQSVWLERRVGEAEIRLVLTTPPDLLLRSGRWRALVSADGVVLGQFSVLVPGGG